VYSSWYPLQSFLAVPVVAVALKASSTLHVPVHYVESLSVTVLPALYTALTIPVIYLLAQSLGSDEAGAWLAGLLYGSVLLPAVYQGFLCGPAAGSADGAPASSSCFGKIRCGWRSR